MESILIGGETNEIVETEISSRDVLHAHPLVSVMMSTYNHEEYLAQAIEGVVSQKTDFPFELLIGEDCSTDNTRAIALDYQRRFPHIVRVVYSNENVGAFNNANRTFMRVRGEFVAWCEGDDYWQAPGKLQIQVDFLRNNPGYGMVHSEYDWLVHILGNWRRIKNWNKRACASIPQGEVFSSLLVTMFIRTCTMMGRTSLVAEHFNSKLRSNLNPAGDWAIALHLAGLAKVGYIDNSLATYRRNLGSMTNVNGYGNYLALHKKKPFMYNNFSSLFPISEDEWLEINKTLAKEMVFSAFDARSKSDFDQAIASLKRYSPAFLSDWRVWTRGLLMKTRVSSFMAVFVRNILRELSLYRLSTKDSLGK